ncbi:glycosyltransferase family 4 protein [Collimonas fungivorans]|uniref:Glycosyltransferase n=1 Tax=Collimonas fungivorans (strain Ter331) TaxID=1005048 RepID=G0A8W3_COLFT|nr:glycosyltransferase family 4 protein [Collimonas fungivorans]AEK61826.1 Glycosyltransferase [Collimonas fungivorans Ter331]
METPEPVLHVLNVAETIKGGVATYLETLERLSADFNCRFDYLVPAAQADQLKAERVHHHSHSRGGLGPFKLALAIVRQVRKSHPDMVYAHSTFAGVALCLAKPWLGRKVKTIYCAHGWASFRDRSRSVTLVTRAIEKIMSYIPNAVIDISRYEHVNNRKFGFSRNCILIQNTVLDRILPPAKDGGNQDDGRLHILFVGRLDHQKGYDILVDAIRILQKSRPNYVYHIVGAPVLANLQIEMLEAANVHYYGWIGQAEINAYYDLADVLVMPSRAEGFGLTALEAFRSYVPVVASNRGALPDIVEHAVNGLIFNCTAGDLAEKLENLNRTSLGDYAEAARASYLIRFSPGQFIASYQKLFSRLRQTN